MGRRYQLTQAPDGSKMIVDLWDIRAVVSKRDAADGKTQSAIMYATSGHVNVVDANPAEILEWLKESGNDGNDDTEET